MADPAEGIKDLLVAAGVGTFGATSGWGIYIFKEPDSPDTVVTIYNTGGTPSNPQWLVDYPSIQVKVRGTLRDYPAMYIKARAIKDALLGLPSQSVNGDQWVSIRELGGLASLGADESDRPMIVQNYSLIIEPQSGTYRTAL